MDDLIASDTAAAPERPVYLCTRNTELGAAIAFDLRHYGFKARTFVSLSVMRNAAQSAPPANFILDAEMFGDDPALWAEARPLRDIAPLLFLAERDDFATRFRAARAGGSAFVTQPVSLMTLMYELRRSRADRDHTGRRVVAVTAGETRLATHVRGLAERGWECVTLTPEQLPAVAAGDEPSLILLDADLADYDAGALLRMARQIHQLAAVPVLLCTSGDKRRLDELVAREGADGTLGLPVDVADLEAIVAGRVRRAAALADALRFVGYRDPLTGLHTPNHFVESLSQSVATGAFERAHAGIVLAEFAAPQPADSGRLVRAAEVMRRKLPPFATTARLGDRMLAAAFLVSSEPELEAVAKSLREGMTALGQAAPEVGVAVLDGNVSSVEAALEAARQAYPGAGAAADAQAANEAPEEAAGDLGDYWTTRVRQALRDNRFRLVYQPISSLNGQPSALYEVFVRLLDNDDSDILPQEFLPAVRRSGLSAALDRWIIGRAIHVLSEHPDRLDQPRLFVKVFPESLADDNLAGWIVDQARTAGLTPDRLVIEIPQRAASTRTAQIHSFCRTLDAAGLAVAIENFTPHDNGIEILRALSPAYVKLSAEVSDSAHVDRHAQRQVTEVASQARAMGIATIASQVQDAIVLSALWQSGVEYIQGYFMQEPADVFAGEPGPAD